ncbi:putative metalloprotease CJM1_0395 family protein [Echinimonas agarilytica]|uniref:SprA-related family protein n=1 Tax=Echinimonas agarilytica TaxID=1215918 RepID=A0AA42B8V9_9GAMM|nr:putative metalloprotease CJM1_0395 family protein [Echinimonas agarilytica]MCM2680903.1 hypothetical protein [Echinimonas agarilytica]
MNLVSNYAHVPLSPVNPQTQALAHDNQVREVIRQPSQVEPFPREPGIAKDQEQQRGNTKEPRQRAGGEAALSDSSSRLNQSTDVVDAIEGDPESQQQNASDQDQQPNGGQRDSNASAQSKSTSEESAQDVREQVELAELQSRDLEVKAHERAHASVGGQYAGAPNYSYERGPDGRQYAVEGTVSIDLTPIQGDPQATITKMRQVRAAATAPAEPSAQDLKVAAEANRQIAQAQAELLSGEASSSQPNAAPREFSGENSTTSSAINSALESKETAGFSAPAQVNSAIAEMAKRNDVISAVYRNSSVSSVAKSSFQLSA